MTCVEALILEMNTSTLVLSLAFRKSDNQRRCVQ